MGASVELVAKIKTCGEARMVHLPGGLTITYKHPIQIDNQWCYPKDVGTEVEKCEYVYNFVLSNDHILIVNGVRCITMGHDLTLLGADGEPIGKPFYGAPVKRHLEQTGALARGYVEVE